MDSPDEADVEAYVEERHRKDAEVFEKVSKYLAS